MSSATMWGGRLPLEAGTASSAPVTVGQREWNPSDIWDSLNEGPWCLGEVSVDGMVMGVGSKATEGAARRKK